MTFFNNVLASSVTARVWTAATLTCLLAMSCAILDIQPRPALLAVAFFLSLAVYSLDTIGPKNLMRNCRETWLLHVIFIVSLSLFFLLLRHISPMQRAVIIAAFLIGMVYAVPIARINGRLLRFKDLPLVKSAWLAIIITFIAVVLPVVNREVHIGALLLDIIVCAVLAFSNVVLCDIADCKQDKAEGVPTLPAMIGANNCRIIIAAVNSCALLIIVCCIGFQSVPLPRIIGIIPACTILVTMLSVWYPLRENLKALADGIVVIPVIVMALI